MAKDIQKRLSDCATGRNVDPGFRTIHVHDVTDAREEIQHLREALVIATDPIYAERAARVVETARNIVGSAMAHHKFTVLTVPDFALNDLRRALDNLKNGDSK